MATLLIGGNGLVGTALVRYLTEQGEAVISFSAHSPSEEVNGCTYIQGDVTEYGTINMILRKIEFFIMRQFLIRSCLGITHTKFTGLMYLVP